ncbi:hypothetical protein BAS09_12910 [Elizabethkingia ursingii]|nr:hypothetical protein BAS09_12910 [Elizabethkingia ursingii]
MLIIQASQPYIKLYIIIRTILTKKKQGYVLKQLISGQIIYYVFLSFFICEIQTKKAAVNYIFYHKRKIRIYIYWNPQFIYNYSPNID